MNLAIVLTLIGAVIGFAFTFGGENRWIGHAVVSVAGLLWLGEVLFLGARLAGRVKWSSTTSLLKPHRKASVFFAFLVIGTFFYGLSVTAEHEEPLLTSGHAWLGLTIGILAFFQVTSSLTIRNRRAIRVPHRLLGYALALLVLAQVAWGVVMVYG